MHPIFEPSDKGQLEIQQQIIKAMIDQATKPPEPSAQCFPNNNPYTNPIGVDTSFVQGLAQVFCKGDLTKPLTADLTNKNLATRMVRSPLEPRTPPPSSKSYEGYTFHFEYSPGQGQCQMNCVDAYKALTAKCNNQPSSLFPNRSTDIRYRHGC